MEKITFDGWLLEIDREKTRDAYRQYPGGECPCANCQNYRKAAKYLPSELTNLLGRFGLNPAKPLESRMHFENTDGTYFYTAIFNVVGTIRERPKLSDFQLDNKLTKSFSDKYQLGYKTDVEFPRYFPENIFQLEFHTNLPWVIDEVDDAEYE